MVVLVMGLSFGKWGGLEVGFCFEDGSFMFFC
jgi:hypothetical protein